MSRWTVTRTIAAPIETVFSAVADVTQFSRVRPQVVKIEFLSDVHSGARTRFRETRRMKEKDVSTDLEITELRDNDRVHFTADSHGTIWNSVYTVRKSNGSTTLTLTMDAISDGLLQRVMVFMIRGVLQTALEGDMDAVKAFCEAPRIPA